ARGRAVGEWPRESEARACGAQVQRAERVVELAIHERQVDGRGRTPRREPGEDAVDRLAERACPREHARRRGGPAAGLALQGAGGGRGHHAGLSRPLDQLAVGRQPLDRPPAPAPAHRVGEVEAETPARPVKGPSLAHAGVSLDSLIAPELPVCVLSPSLVYKTVIEDEGSREEEGQWLDTSARLDSCWPACSRRGPAPRTPRRCRGR